MRSIYFSIAIALLVSALGCESKPPLPGPTATGPAPTLPTLPAVPPPAPTLPIVPPTAPTLPTLPGSQPPSLPSIPAPPPGPLPVPPPVETEEVKAQLGVGKKGRSLDEYEGVVVTPVKSLFAAQERIVFEIQIPQALNLFQASEGRFPKNHDEFMEKIIGFNQIPLPKLPDNHRYKWDPETHELMVERPKLKAEPSK